MFQTILLTNYIPFSSEHWITKMYSVVPWVDTILENFQSSLEIILVNECEKNICSKCEIQIKLYIYSKKNIKQDKVFKS